MTRKRSLATIIAVAGISAASLLPIGCNKSTEDPEKRADSSYQDRSNSSESPSTTTQDSSFRVNSLYNRVHLFPKSNSEGVIEVYIAENGDEVDLGKSPVINEEYGRLDFIRPETIAHLFGQVIDGEIKEISNGRKGFVVDEVNKKYERDIWMSPEKLALSREGGVDRWGYPNELWKAGFIIDHFTRGTRYVLTVTTPGWLASYQIVNTNYLEDDIPDRIYFSDPKIRKAGKELEGINSWIDLDDSNVQEVRREMQGLAKFSRSRR